MKVIQIMDNLSAGGGVNSFVYDLCHALRELGCDVSLIGILSKGYTDNPEIEALRADGIRVECIGAASKKEALLHCAGKLRNLIRDISGEDPAVCNLHLKLSVLMGVVATRFLRNVKCVETYHNTYHHYHLQCWACSPFIRKYITVSETAKEEMHKRFLIPYKRLAAIPNGVSRRKIRELAGIAEYKHQEGRLRMVSAGRLSYEKNFIVPMRAFVQICNEQITYTLVGSGPQEAELRAIASQNPYIRMTGALSRGDTLRELAQADIVVMPSLWEGRSILQLEAMALDKPMILSDVPGLREPFGENELADRETVRACSFGYLVKTSATEGYIHAALTARDHGDKEEKNDVREKSEENDLLPVAKRYIEQYRNTIALQTV